MEIRLVFFDTAEARQAYIDEKKSAGFQLKLQAKRGASSFIEAEKWVARQGTAITNLSWPDDADYLAVFLIT